MIHALFRRLGRPGSIETRSAKNGRRNRRRRFPMRQLEPLEDRRLLSVVTWDGDRRRHAMVRPAELDWQRFAGSS